MSVTLIRPNNPSFVKPLVYKVVITDYNATISNNSGKVRLTIASDVTGVYAVNTLLSVVSNNGVYRVVATITAISYSAPNTTIDTDIDYTFADANGYVFKPLDLQMYAVDIYNSGRLITPQRVYYPVNQFGELFADITLAVQKELEFTKFNPSNDWDNHTIFEQKARIAIKYYDDNGTTDDTGNVIDVYRGTKQIGETNDASSYILGDNTKKLLTRLNRLNAWTGFPIIVAGITNTVGSNLVNQDNTAIGTATTIAGKHYFISEKWTSSKGASIKIRQASNDLSQSYPVKTHVGCNGDIMLITENDLGGISYWVFSKRAVVEYKNEDRLTKAITVSAAGVSREDWEMLQDFINVSDVYEQPYHFTTDVFGTHQHTKPVIALINNNGTLERYDVVIDTNSSSGNYGDRGFYFELTFFMPEITRQ